MIPDQPTREAQAAHCLEVAAERRTELLAVAVKLGGSDRDTGWGLCLAVCLACRDAIRCKATRRNRCKSASRAAGSRDKPTPEPQKGNFNETTAAGFCSPVGYVHYLVARKFRSRSEFVSTDTELRAMAPAASIGDSSQPVNGYSSPAATGMPSTL